MTELDQRKLEAEICNLQSQAEKNKAEIESLRKTWQNWVLDVIKIAGGIVLGLGGVMAAITGYQLSEVKKERTDFDILQNQAKLKTLQEQNEAAQQTLLAINNEVTGLQQTLETARKERPETAGVLDNAIKQAAKIGTAVAMTKDQLRDQSATTTHPLSDYLVGVQTLGFNDATREQLNEKLRQSGYGLHDLSWSYPANERPAWFAPTSTVFYYAPPALTAAKQLADVMKQLTGQEFAVRQGFGQGVDPNQRTVTLFVHYVKK